MHKKEGWQQRTHTHTFTTKQNKSHAWLAITQTFAAASVNSRHWPMPIAAAGGGSGGSVLASKLILCHQGEQKRSNVPKSPRKQALRHIVAPTSTDARVIITPRAINMPLAPNTIMFHVHVRTQRRRRRRRRRRSNSLHCTLDTIAIDVLILLGRQS